jgi:hypothetical protein
LKHGSCLTCYQREKCGNSLCEELAYCDKVHGSFNFCSPECRDKSELKGANKALQRALKEFEATSDVREDGTPHNNRAGISSYHTQLSGTGGVHTVTVSSTAVPVVRLPATPTTADLPPYSVAGMETSQPAPSTATLLTGRLNDF